MTITAWSRLSSPPFGSDAARPACDGAVDMRQVGVVPCVVPSTNLKSQKQYLFYFCVTSVPKCDHAASPRLVCVFLIDTEVFYDYERRLTRANII